MTFTKIKGQYILIQLPAAIADYERTLAEESRVRYGQRIEPHKRMTEAYWRAWVGGITSHPVNEDEFFVFTLPNLFRGYLALGAYWAGVAPPTLRYIVADVWDHDHHHLMRAVKGRRAIVRAMMRRAEFDVSDLPETFTVYRGVNDIPLSKARLGLSWTTSYEVAAWFAFRFGKRPLVIKAEARRSEVVFHHHGCPEHEVILSRALRSDEVTITDDLAEWQRRCEAHKRSEEAHAAAMKANAA